MNVQLEVSCCPICIALLGCDMTAVFFFTVPVHRRVVPLLCAVKVYNSNMAKGKKNIGGELYTHIHHTYIHNSHKRVSFVVKHVNNLFPTANSVVRCPFPPHEVSG